MPLKQRVKTYGRAKKTDSDYISKPVSPFKISGASTAIDALFSKNIKKRNLFVTDEKTIHKKNRKDVKISELPAPVNPLLIDDSLNVKINSTFDNLLRGSIYNPVNLCNKSSFYINNSTDTSCSKIESEKLDYLNGREKRKCRNYGKLHSKNNHSSWETSHNNSVLSNGKIKKRKNNPRRLKQIIKNVVINISDTPTNQNISKKIHSYLDKSINFSLIIDKQYKKHNTSKDKSNLCARKFTPIISKSNLLSEKSQKNYSVFQNGFRHLMRAENTPRLIHASTPIFSRNMKICDKPNVSPITVNTRHKLDFTPNHSKSLFDSKKFDEVSSIKNTDNMNENDNPSIILINSTIPEIIAPENIPNLSENVVIINDSNDNLNSLPQVKNSLINVNEDKVSSEALGIHNNQIKTKSFILNDEKLNGQAIVLLEKHPILENPFKKNVSLKSNILSNDNENHCITHTFSENKSLKEDEYLVNTRFRINSKISQISNRSHVVIKELSNFGFSIKNNYFSNVENELINSTAKSLFSYDEHFNTDKCNGQTSNLRMSSANCSKSVDNIETEIITRSKSRSNSVKINTANDLSKHIYIQPNKVTNNSPESSYFTRKKNVQINIESTNNCINKDITKPPNISTETWKQYTNCKVIVPRIEDCKDLKRYSEVFKMSNNYSFGKKIYTNKTNDRVVTRDSIYLKPGKKWFRSLSSLRRTNNYEPDMNNSLNKGRKWQRSIYEILEQQDYVHGGFRGFNKVTALNDMKHKIRLRATLGVRKSLKIVNISVKDTSILADETSFENKSGYVSPLAHVSILDSLDKLSLSTDVDDCKDTARQIILKRCGQTDPILFDDCYSSRTLKKCRKIGEGVYGEVFMYKSLDNKCRVMKVIPIEGNLVVNGERQKKFEEIISEIIIASELSNLRINNEFCTNGFVELLKICCVQGKYPQHLLDLWNLYDEEHGSENDSPEIFADDQMYMVLELANGGQDLESYRFTNAEQSYALFVQIVCSLAVAESAFQFEHRDMHWGNILISSTDETTTTFQLKGREFEVATRGVKVSIIDFTLSRMTYSNCCIYNDLATDPDLFTATGDYQFDIYRLMKQRNLNNWQEFEPYTNILWLDYTLEKMINHARYIRENTKTHKTCMKKLSQLRKKILNYNSATDLLNSTVFSHVFL